MTVAGESPEGVAGYTRRSRGRGSDLAVLEELSLLHGDVGRHGVDGRSENQCTASDKPSPVSVSAVRYTFCSLSWIISASKY
eukprot:scaffold278459_cov46-Prasinocladus_malaysianus.AAC.3